MLTFAAIYAASGLLILLGGALHDPKSRFAIAEAVVWSVVMAVVWPAFLLLIAKYYWEDHISD